MSHSIAPPGTNNLYELKVKMKRDSRKGPQETKARLFSTVVNARIMHDIVGGCDGAAKTK